MGDGRQVPDTRGPRRPGRRRPAHADAADLSPSCEIWVNNGTGTYTNSGQTFGDDDTYAVALGDLDEDGDLDAYVTNYEEANKVWLNG